MNSGLYEILYKDNLIWRNRKTELAMEQIGKDKLPYFTSFY